MGSNIQEKIKKLPLTCGVYLMKNAAGDVIYVGKAISLRKRVQSYFRKASHPDPKTNRLIAEVFDIAHIDTTSEAEALILEASLIKKHDPCYNIDLRDDKSYPLIEISGEEFPKIAVVRPRKKNIKSKYFGPMLKLL